MFKIMLIVSIFCSCNLAAIKISVTSTELGGKLGSINRIELEVDESITVEQLINKAALKFGYFNDIVLTNNFVNFTLGDKRSLIQAGISNNSMLKAYKK